MPPGGREWVSVGAGTPTTRRHWGLEDRSPSSSRNGHHPAMTNRIPRAVALVAVLASLGVAAPAFAQSAASRIDQPTPGTLPSGTSHDGGNGRVAPPSAIKSSTDVMKGGAVQGDGAPSRTNPIQHLPKDMR